MTGVDLSNYQSGLMLRNLKDSGHTFAILKATEGTGYRDMSFRDFVDQAKSLDIPIGAYCYSHATYPERAMNEAGAILSAVKDIDLPLGIYMDVEKPEQFQLSNSQLQEVIEAFCRVIRAAGYRPGLYGSELGVWYKVNADTLSPDIMKWVANYSRKPKIDCDIWQSGDTGKVLGYSGNVDMDVALSQRAIDIITAKKEKPVLDPDKMFPPNPTVLALQFWMTYDGIDTPIDGKKTSRFFSDFDNFISNPSKMSDATVLAYQLWLNYNNYRVPSDGRMTNNFIEVLKEFSYDMKRI